MNESSTKNYLQMHKYRPWTYSFKFLHLNSNYNNYMIVSGMSMKESLKKGQPFDLFRFMLVTQKKGGNVNFLLEASNTFILLSLMNVVKILI